MKIQDAQYKNGRKFYLCLCECGQQKWFLASNVETGKSKSCGCKKFVGLQQKNSRYHGKSKTGMYGLWANMLQRCQNPKQEQYKNYGGRGIFVCDRWQKFELFLKDMGERPEGMWLERKDNDGPYSPENCCWATPSEQNANKRNNLNFTMNGKTQHLAAWAKELGVKYTTLYARVTKQNIPLEAAY